MGTSPFFEVSLSPWFEKISAESLSLFLVRHQIHILWRFFQVIQRGIRIGNPVKSWVGRGVHHCFIPDIDHAAVFEAVEIFPSTFEHCCFLDLVELRLKSIAALAQFCRKTDLKLYKT